MNTSKQVNAMIGLLFLSILLFGAVGLYEGTRQTEAQEAQDEVLAERGAEIYVTNCRSCHGMLGEGHIGPPLHTNAFLTFPEDNDLGIPGTPIGEVDGIRTFLHNTIACGRTGTFMPTWSQEYGGPLSDIQIEYLVELITQGRWDLVEEIGAEHDAATETADAKTPEDILVQDASSLAVTEDNCGQYAPESIESFRSRDPFSTATPTPEGEATATPEGTEGPSAPVEGGVAVTLSEFAVEAPASTEAGEVAFNVTNEGAVAHNLRVVSTDLADDALPVAGGAVDESALELVVETEDIPGGDSVTATAELEPGGYVLFCNVSGHYQLGMHTSFTVE